MPIGEVASIQNHPGRVLAGFKPEMKMCPLCVPLAYLICAPTEKSRRMLSGLGKHKGFDLYSRGKEDRFLPLKEEP